MATKKVTRSKSTKKPSAKAPPPPRAAGLNTVEKIKLCAFQLTGKAFDGGEELLPDCTPADLFNLVFDAPNAHEDFLEQVICCVGDDLELIAAAACSDHGLDDVIERVANRNHFRIKVGLEVARRMKAYRAIEVRP